MIQVAIKGAVVNMVAAPGDVLTVKLPSAYVYENCPACKGVSAHILCRDGDGISYVCGTCLGKCHRLRDVSGEPVRVEVVEVRIKKTGRTTYSLRLLDTLLPVDDIVICDGNLKEVLL